RNTCPRDGVSFPEIAPRLFSFNSPHDACPACDGHGTREEQDPARVVPDPDRPLRDAIEPWGSGRRRPRYPAALRAALAGHFAVTPDTPWRALPEAGCAGFPHGVPEPVAFDFERAGRAERVVRPWDGVLGELARRGDDEALARFRSPRSCSA